MSARCLKLLLLVSLIPLALRATSLLTGGHGAPAPSSSRRSSWDYRSRPAATTSSTAAATAAATSRRVVSVAHTRPSRQARRRRRAENAPAAPDGWFEDDKRLAPTGSNPLHNLR
ncbi:hypothetical protein BS78_03G049000 [Paspalum vaginatum]|nr:hypothetical protein BS78_03G049000 [Paspalum vaginatum]